jgi:hypothetical protein
MSIKACLDYLRPDPSCETPVEDFVSLGSMDEIESILPVELIVWVEPSIDHTHSPVVLHIGKFIVIQGTPSPFTCNILDALASSNRRQ